MQGSHNRFVQAVAAARAECERLRAELSTAHAAAADQSAAAEQLRAAVAEAEQRGAAAASVAASARESEMQHAAEAAAEAAVAAVRADATSKAAAVKEKAMELVKKHKDKVRGARVAGCVHALYTVRVAQAAELEQRVAALEADLAHARAEHSERAAAVSVRADRVAASRA